ncbi:MAG: hypothetical protein H7326_10670 [Bdellovibrionaceae bacterium]|nr:hypothetical protein [Pseudobdellovibrionaceae bacterium]
MSLNRDLRLFRILMGALSLCVFASLWPNWELYFSAALYPSKHTLIQNFLQQALGLHIGVVVSGLLILGIFPRLCCLILWLMLWGLAILHPSVMTSADEILRMFLFLSIWAPLWLQRFSFLSIYVAGAIGKIVTGSAWLQGTALAAIMVDPNWGRFVPGSLDAYSGPIAIANYLVLGFEILFPVLIISGRLRWPVILMAFLFHLSIALLMKNLMLFSFAMICGLALFAPRARRP